ncbi:hypothetical protein RRG08_027858 [Elysia crispata]|uniref:Uncharacterized protein n=1 Tax=Elysia crispata TaxID=231223 RepID=A0AAE0YTZ4_9GAST|nr:hypothetical protein RRG08_027858 [Elysia crispata]
MTCVSIHHHAQAESCRKDNKDLINGDKGGKPNSKKHRMTPWFLLVLAEWSSLSQTHKQLPKLSSSTLNYSSPASQTNSSEEALC